MTLDKVAFLQERNEKEWKNFKVYDAYTPDLKKPLLTSKFYSKYEGQKHEDADPELMERISKAKYAIPQERYSWPITENQWYGWFYEPLFEVDKNDKRFYHPRRTADFIKHELQLKMDESALPKVKFTGIPFKVQ